MNELENTIVNLSLSDLVKVNNAIAEVNECLDDEIFDVQDMDEILESKTAYEIACMCQYGSFNPLSPYFKFDGYGNLESIDYSDQISIDIDDVLRVYDSDCRDFLPSEVIEVIDEMMNKD